MADHIVEQILVKIQAVLKAAATGAGNNVFRNRSTAIPEDTAFPIINQLQGPIRPLAGRDGFLNLNYIDSELEVYLDLAVASIDVAGEATETALNQLWKQAHMALLAGGVTNLGLTFVFIIFPTGADEPVLHSEADQQYVTMRTSWAVRFRTNLSDPTQVS